MVSVNLRLLFKHQIGIACILTHVIINQSAVGNRRFRSVVSEALEEYTEATSKWAKSMVAAKLVGVIHRDGGRFLKQRKGNDEEWYELSLRDAKAKASHAIRDAIAAKEKTKAIKAGTASKPTPQMSSASKKKRPPKQNEPPRGKKAQTMESDTRYDGASFGSPHSLSSIARPVFGMGGPHPSHFSVFSGSSVQDQIQHLRSQDFQTSAGSFSSSFPGLTQMRPFEGLTQMRGFDSMEPMGVPPVARRPFPREVQVVESKQGLGSGSDDSDGDFLSLIDNVLGPMHQNQRGNES